MSGQSNGVAAGEKSHTASQRYLSTRGEDEDVCFLPV